VQERTGATPNGSRECARGDARKLASRKEELWGESGS
jgi:hypothetical protein